MMGFRMMERIRKMRNSWVDFVEMEISLSPQKGGR